MKIGDDQIKILSLATQYYKKLSSIGVDVAASAYCWLLNIPGAPGYFILRSLKENRKLNIKGIYFLFKQFIAISILHDFKLFKKVNNEINYDKLIISWAKKSDFQLDGSYTDRYFKVNSKNISKTIWFLLYLDEHDLIPKNIDDNIIIFGKENLKSKYNFFYFFKVFLKLIKENKGSIIKIFHSCSRRSHFAKITSKAVSEIVKSKDFKTVFTAYDAQPFQNKIFEEIRKISSDIKLVGYLHATQPLPLLNMHRQGAPDLLLVHGSSQVFHLQKYLNWPKNKLRLIPALRYNKEDITRFDNNLVLPINLSSEKILLNQFRIYLEKTKKESLKPFIIKNHPHTNNSQRHKKFIYQLNRIIEEFSNRFSAKAKDSVSLFFGGTSSVLEALESGLKVLHLCADPVLESYSETLWPSIKVREINEHTLVYSLRSYGKCINFSTENNMFEKYCIL